MKRFARGLLGATFAIAPPKSLKYLVDAGRIELPTSTMSRYGASNDFNRLGHTESHQNTSVINGYLSPARGMLGGAV